MSCPKVLLNHHIYRESKVKFRKLHSKVFLADLLNTWKKYLDVVEFNELLPFTSNFQSCTSQMYLSFSMFLV